MRNLWTDNHPRNFWQCQPDPPDEVWQAAIAGALPLLELPIEQPDAAAILELTLGEGRFGKDHWRLSFPKRVYYILKPLLPRTLTRMMRRAYQRPGQAGLDIPWPTESRYVSFLENVLARVLQATPGHTLLIKSLWPEGRSWALVLTHDVEARTGFEYVRKVADLEEALGFRSSFNFVPEDYPLDMNLVKELQDRGFEVGIHGLKHDGRLFETRARFERSAAKINQYLKQTGAVGFRAPLTLRNPEWMQLLNLEYDLSFFDTDPFEPMRGGTMSIWPFFLGRFIELPYTLVQDYTLTDILQETTPRLWLDKVDFLSKHGGMALLNSHPDYLRTPFRMDIYTQFLHAMRERQDCWMALPQQASAWWQQRATSTELSMVSLDNTGIQIVPQEDVREWSRQPAVRQTATP